MLLGVAVDVGRRAGDVPVYVDLQPGEARAVSRVEQAVCVYAEHALPLALGAPTLQYRALHQAAVNEPPQDDRDLGHDRRLPVNVVLNLHYFTALKGYVDLRTLVALTLRPGIRASS